MDFSQINIGLGFPITNQVIILQTFLFSFPDLSSERGQGQVIEEDILIRWNRGVLGGGCLLLVHQGVLYLIFLLYRSSSTIKVNLLLMNLKRNYI